LDASTYETPSFTTAGHTANHVYPPALTGAFTTNSPVSLVSPSNSVSLTVPASAPAWSLTNRVCPRRSHAGEHDTLPCSVISAPASTTSGETSTAHVT